MQMYMNVVFKTIGIFFFVIFLQGCKDDDCPEQTSIIGTYTVDVRVTKRPPVIHYTFGRPDSIPYDHQIIYGEIMDTTQVVCCLGQLPLEDSCYTSYSLQNIKIYKENNQYYLQNSISFNLYEEQITFHIPLTKLGDSLIHDKNRSDHISHFIRNKSKMPSTANSYPSSFDLLYFSIEDKSSDVLKGKWVFKDYSGDNCGTDTMSNGRKYPCKMGEFAELTFTRTD